MLDDNNIFNDPNDDYAQNIVEKADLDKLKRMFREAAEAQQEERRLSFRDQDFYDGYHQLDPSVRAKLRKRGQPETYWNIISEAVDGTLGVLDQSATSPEAIARNDNGEEAAIVVTKVLRYLADKTDMDEVKRQTSLDNIVMGTCAAIVEVDAEMEGCVTPIHYDEFFYDPYSRALDFTDARYLIHARWVDLSVARQSFPELSDSICLTTGFSDLGPEDQPEQLHLWSDIARKRVLIVNIFYLENQVWQNAIFTHTVVLKSGPSPFLDDAGQPTCPIVAVSFKRSREGQRFGLVRDMVPLQTAINSRHSRMLHLANSSQVQAVESTAPPVDPETARREASKADGVIPMGFQKVATTDMFQSNYVLLQGEVAAIQRKAPSPAVLGRNEGANQSGRARQIAAQAGLTELARGYSRLERWEERVFEQLWFRAIQFMDQPKLLRVTNDQGAKENLQINQPVIGPAPVMIPVTDAQGQPIIDTHTGQPAMRPQLDPMGHPVIQPQVVGMKNELARMTVDITISTVRQAITLRQEAIDAMLEYSAKTGVSILDPQFEFLLELSDIPDKSEILEKYQTIRAKAAQQAAGNQQAQAQAAQVDLQAKAAKANKDNAAAQRDQSLAQSHLIQAHEQALDYTVKAEALKQAAAHSPMFAADLAQSLGSLN